MAELTKLYEEHAGDRDRFEVLAICNTEGENAQTSDVYNAIAAPIVEEVWNGTQLPFPVLIDGQGKRLAFTGSKPARLLWKN